MILRAIDRRRHNAFATEASLHGYKIPFRFNREQATKKDQVEVNEADEKLIAQMRQESQERVRSRYGVRTHN